MYKTTKALLFSNTIKLHHLYLTQPPLTPAYRVTHALSILTCALQDLPTITCNAQLGAIACTKSLFGKVTIHLIKPTSATYLGPH